VHRQRWPCAQPSELKTFVHQDFHGIHLGTFFGLSNPLISKTTNFIFSQNSPPSSLVMPWCTDNLGHVQTPPNSKLSCTKNFMVFSWRHSLAFPTLSSQKPRISFFHKTPHQAMYLCRGAPPTLAMCTTLRIQNIRAPRFSWYSFGDICRPFQRSHLKNHEFNFLTKLPTKQSSYAVVHLQPLPCANPSELKTLVHQEFHGIHLGTFVGLSNPPRISVFPTSIQFKTYVHQDFYSTHLGTFVGLSNPHISKTTNFIFSQNSPPSHLPMPWCTANLSHVHNPPNTKHSCTKIFMVFIWGHL